MVDKEVVFDRIDYIRQSLKRLERFKELSKEEFLANDDYFAIAEHHLRRGIEAILDIGRHICVSDNLGQPQEYREIFTILGKNKVIAKDFADQIKAMAGYRNRLVHMYNQVKKEEVYEIIQTKIDDFERFCEEVINYI